MMMSVKSVSSKNGVLFSQTDNTRVSTAQPLWPLSVIAWLYPWRTPMKSRFKRPFFLAHHVWGQSSRSLNASFKGDSMHRIRQKRGPYAFSETTIFGMGANGRIYGPNKLWVLPALLYTVILATSWIYSCLRVLPFKNNHSVCPLVLMQQNR